MVSLNCPYSKPIDPSKHLHTHWPNKSPETPWCFTTTGAERNKRRCVCKDSCFLRRLIKLEGLKQDMWLENNSTLVSFHSEIVVSICEVLFQGSRLTLSFRMHQRTINFLKTLCNWSQTGTRVQTHESTGNKNIIINTIVKPWSPVINLLWLGYYVHTVQFISNLIFSSEDA